MKSFKTEGIVIKRRNTGEADRIITVFTKYNGKLRIKAPGVRKITSRRSSHIELLNLSVLTLYHSSRSQIPILTEAQTLHAFDMIKGDLAKIGKAFYVCELVDKLCPENQENRAIFHLIKQTLKTFNYSDESRIVDEFEEKILSILGFMPHKYPLLDRQAFIEQILERKLRTRDILPLLLS